MSAQGEGQGRRARSVVGYFGLVCAAVFVWTAFNEYTIGTMSSPGAAVFPIIVGTCLLIASVMVLFEARQPSNNVPRLDVAPKHLRRAAIVFAMFLAYILLMPTLGFLLATTAFLLAVFRFLSEMRWLTVGAWAVGVGLVFYALFDQVFGLPLPQGLLDIG